MPGSADQADTAVPGRASLSASTSTLSLAWRPTNGSAVHPARDPSRPGRLECVVLPQHRLMQLPQLAAGLDSELVDQRGARGVEGFERSRLPARAVERDHQLTPGSLAQWMLRDQRVQLTHDGAWRPAARSSSIRFSRHARRSSSRRAISPCAERSNAKSESAGPRQNDSASCVDPPRPVAGSGRGRDRRPPRRRRIPAASSSAAAAPEASATARRRPGAPWPQSPAPPPRAPRSDDPPTPPGSCQEQHREQGPRLVARI